MDKYFLLIETSDKVCSVSLCDTQNNCIERVSYEPNSHSKYLSLFIEDLLAPVHDKKQQLLGIGVSSGPGSYTGLRIGVSTAKGLAYSLDLPLLQAGTLEIMVHTLKAEHSQLLKEVKYLIPMIDARRMEVYTAIFDRKGNYLSDVINVIVDQDSFKNELKQGKIIFFGNGAEKVQSILEHSNALFFPELYPLSRYMLPIIKRKYEQKQFENIAYFEPFYLKPFIPTTKPKKILP